MRYHPHWYDSLITCIVSQLKSVTLVAGCFQWLAWREATAVLATNPADPPPEREVLRRKRTLGSHPPGRACRLLDSKLQRLEWLIPDPAGAAPFTFPDHPMSLPSELGKQF